MAVIIVIIIINDLMTFGNVLTHKSANTNTFFDKFVVLLQMIPCCFFYIYSINVT